MAIVDLILPKMGESIMEATILKWRKNVGDPVQVDEPVLDIATDKVDSEVPSTAEGTIVEILYKENDVVPVDTVIARIQTKGDDNAAPQQNTFASSTPSATEETIKETNRRSCIQRNKNSAQNQKQRLQILLSSCA